MKDDLKAGSNLKKDRNTLTQGTVPCGCRKWNGRFVNYPYDRRFLNRIGD